MSYPTQYLYFQMSFLSDVTSLRSLCQMFRGSLEWFHLLHLVPLATLYLWSLKQMFPLVFHSSLSLVPLWSPHLSSEYSPLHLALDLSSLTSVFLCVSLQPFSLCCPPSTSFTHCFPPLLFSLFLPASCLWMLSPPLLTFLLNDLTIYHVLWI